MTRRERLERKIENRRDWADGRRGKADALRSVDANLRHDWAFITQPGHIPARARMNARDDRAAEHVAMANHHESKAAGLAAQLERTVFSDDGDALERIEARIAENEAKRDRMKLVNKLYSKDDAAGLAALGIDLEQLKCKLAAAGPYWGGKPHLPYELTNLGARIRDDRKRIEDIQALQQRTEKAEAAGVLIEGAEYVRVTFPEKPSREILDGLRAAGFRWGSGSWVGRRDALPEAVIALTNDSPREERGQA